MPWLGGSVGWSIIPYTKRLKVQSPVRALWEARDQCFSLTLMFLSLFSINNQILR